MPAGYGISQSHEGLLTWEHVSARMATAHNYWLVSASPAGRPHAAPVWGVWLDEMFLFSTDPASRKGRNMAVNPQAVVHLESGDDVVILEGAVEAVSDRGLLERYAGAYDKKYGLRPDVSGPMPNVYGLRPRKAQAWLEKDFPTTATTWRLNAR